MKRTIVLAATLACIGAGSLAAPAAPKSASANASASAVAAAPWQRQAYVIPHQKFVLQNGLTLIVHTDHSVPVVGVNLWYHVGSRNEKRGKTGFAHLFEHFFFNGSENYPHGFREAMDDLGANNRNGTTNTDRTNFFEDVPVSALERTLYLEADRMGFLGNYISKDMLERERGVVQNEKRQGENQPYGRVHLEKSARMYPYSHPYSWPVIGSMEDLAAASLDDIREWYRTYYGPNNAVISLAGDITPERALELVRKYFESIPPGPPLPRTEAWIPQLERNVRDEMDDHVPQVRIYRSWHAPGWRDSGMVELGMVTDVLANTKSARLNRRLIDEKRLATAVSAGVDASELSSTFDIVVTVRAGVDPALAEKELDAVLAELLDEGPTAAEVARVKASTLASFARSIERLGGFGGRSDVLAESMTYGGAPDAYLQQLDTLSAARPATLKATAAQWLRAPHYTMTVKPFAKVSAAAATLDRKVLPALGEAPDVKFPAMQKATLSNGLQVILLERHSAPIVNVAVAIDAGTAADTPGKAGLASLTLELLNKGTRSGNRTRDAYQISDAFESLGARLFTGTGPDMSLVRLQATSAGLAPSLALLAEAVLAPSFPADEFALAKQRRLAQIAQEKAQPNALALRTLPAILYGTGSSYALPASGFDASVAGLSRDDLAAWHRAWFKPGSTTIVVTGDTTLAQVVPLLEAAFGKWQAGRAPAKSAVAAPAAATAGPAARRIYLIDKPDAQQSTILAGHLSLPPGQPEDLALEPVMQNFGGMATSRLNRNLRLDKHWSYGGTGRMTSVRGPRNFFTLIAVQSDKTRESLIEVDKEIRDIAGKRPIEGEEFTSIMRNMTSRLAGRFETINALESAALETVNLGLPEDYWANYAAGMRALDPPQLAGAAGKFIRPDDVVWLVVGDLRKIEPRIRELGWGEVTVLDNDGKPLR
ncbi:insulinase family protein [Massilia dura]|uniref:Insulinase family protein n=1 Tax=Pseudoduganella dura TaxID=321982 RepID=A0A6I3XBU7_9BURK|nr:pitrilysin family protein [Pseudoduganella dura]MUI13156.1 insulinase family protein [Pseudoduganella dura]GGY07792.1 peptidase M16 [Pseudoduganella dura]